MPAHLLSFDASQWLSAEFVSHHLVAVSWPCLRAPSSRQLLPAGLFALSSLMCSDPCHGTHSACHVVPAAPVCRARPSALQAPQTAAHTAQPGTCQLVLAASPSCAQLIVVQARTDSGPDRRMSSLSTAAPAEDAEQAVQSYQLNQQDLDLYIDCLVSWTLHMAWGPSWRM